jgi:hypothetical protein
VVSAVAAIWELGYSYLGNCRRGGVSKDGEMIRTFKHARGMLQKLAVADLINGGADVLVGMASAPVALVYSDPPWSPGNEKWWRRYAGEDPPDDYNDLLDAWCRAVVALAPRDVFCEQSANDAHRGLFLAAVARRDAWRLPLLELWSVRYGSSKLPNVLLHFGHTPITTDPSGMSGVKMTRTVLRGLAYQAGETVADPCMGLGMTSRLAHERGWNVIGTELNPKRLDRTIGWLLSHGYTEVCGG